MKSIFFTAIPRTTHGSRGWSASFVVHRLWPPLPSPPCSDSARRLSLWPFPLVFLAFHFQVVSILLKLKLVLSIWDEESCGSGVRGTSFLGTARSGRLPFVATIATALVQCVSLLLQQNSRNPFRVMKYCRFTSFIVSSHFNEYPQCHGCPIYYSFKPGKNYDPQNACLKLAVLFVADKIKET